jgi:D-alanyl-D-alanine carboxypeptidase
MHEILTATVETTGALTTTSAREVVPWWSFTKTLIAAAALRLAEAGRLDLDARLRKRPYTLRQLLRHRAGLPDYGALPAYADAIAHGDAPWTDVELFTRLDAESLRFSPGAGWAYSNVGYLVVLRQLERLCNMGFAEVLRAWVLDPLGLAEARLARTRDDMRATHFPGAWDYDPGWVFHGTVIGPVAEAALALHRMTTEGFLSPASRAAMLGWHPVGGALPGRPWLTAGYGLGVMTGTMRGPRGPVFLAGHGAAGPGSVGAVYRCLGSEPGRTVAAFAAGADEGAVETRALRNIVNLSAT